MRGWGGTTVGIEQRLLARFRAAHLPHHEPLVVGFSGGPDSLALAAALTHVQAVTGLPLLLVHVDHALRDTSGHDAETAVLLGNQLGLEVVVRRVPVAPQEAHPNSGIEEAARRERYRLLGEEAHRAGARTITTAHHREDQAETVLLHLLRGSGLHGAAGMAELAPLPATTTHDISQKDKLEPIRLWRPLLREPRGEILAYLEKRGLSPINDPSNDDITLRRNALRHRAIPEMERAFPGAAAALARFAAIAAEEDLLLEGLVDRALPRVLDPENRMRVATLGEVPRALQRRIMRRWLVEATGESTIGAERVEAVLRWATRSGAAGTIELPGGWCVRRSGEWLIVEAMTDGGSGEGSSQ